MRRLPSPWPALLTVGLLLLIAAPAVGAEPNPVAAFQVGSDVFRRILYERGFTALHRFNELGNDPADKILIVFGDANRLTEVPGGLEQFVRHGGALFLATDRALYGQAKRDLVNATDVYVARQSMVCLDADSCYRGLKYCPFLQNVPGATPDLFRNLEGKSPLSIVASNAPSYLERAPLDLLNWVHRPRLSGLALLPTHCSLEGNKNPLESPLLFAVGGDVGAGRVLVLADHSIFINEMMLPNDNGNVEFTYNCLEWLRGDAKNGRNQVLFVVDGQIKSNFHVPLKDKPDVLAQQVLEYLREHPDEAAKLALNVVANHPKETAQLAIAAAGAADKASQKIAPELERSIQEVDERDGVNNSLLQGFADPDGLLRGLAVWLAVLVVLYGCYKIGWKARHRSDLQGPLLSAALHRLAPADTVMEQRRRDLVRGDNLWEPAHDLAQQSLAAYGLSSAVPPRIVVEGGWLRRWTMTGRVRRLWRLAYGPPARVSLREWQRLLREVQKLKTALANGAVRLQG